MNDALPSTNQGAAGPLIPVLAVVGVGLIGGSFAAALRQAGQVGRACWESGAMRFRWRAPLSWV